MIELVMPNGQVRHLSGGTVTLPRTGIWMADLELMDQEVQEGQVILRVGKTSMPAHIMTCDPVGGGMHLRLVGGHGGLGEPARPKHYSNPLLRHVLTDLLRDAGERLSPLCTTSVLTHQFEAWTTLDRPTGAIIAALCALAGRGANWRVLPDGNLWVGVESWPQSEADARTLDYDGYANARLLGTDAHSVWPGTTLNGRHIDTVTYDLEANRTHVLFAEDL